MMADIIDVNSHLSGSNWLAFLRVLIGLSGSVLAIVLGKMAKRRIAASPGDGGAAAGYARYGVALGWAGLLIGMAFQFWFVMPDSAPVPGP
jgi:hypothetical protein